jgi:peptidoglycan/xylan/chitin deacetylase (PgdA/CDA1 family)
LVFDKAAQKLSASDLKLKHIQADSLQKWIGETKQDWLNSFKSASASCQTNALACGFQGSRWSELTTFANRFVTGQIAGEKYVGWLNNSQVFYTAYLREQLRLAALFPKPSSEILKLNETEVLGSELPDGNFILSLDDGPTAASGNTEKYARMLSEQHISAVFFVLGNALQQRMKATAPQALKNLYTEHCLGSHGYVHEPHAQGNTWRSSLEKTSTLIQQIFPNNKVVFRPPYGQRSVELTRFVVDRGGKVILWNIDSQDWNDKIAKNEVGSRVKKLMLLKRRGIILFHDVHDKGLTALPEIIEFAAKSGVTWADCHTLY